MNDESIKNKLSSRLFVNFSLFFVAVVCIIPFISVYINATRSNVEIARGFSFIIGKSLVENWTIMESKINFLRALLNSVIIAFSGTALSCYFGSMAGYALSKINFTGRKIVFAIVIGTLITPWQIGIVGFFDLVNKYNMLDTYWPLIIPAIGNPATVFFTRQYIERAVHDELIEAARVEGASDLTIFHRHVLPLAAPAIFTMGLIVFVSLWNNYINPLVVLISQERMPIPVVLNLITSPQDYNPGATSLALALSVSIAVLIFSLFYKQIFNANNMGAVKE